MNPLESNARRVRNLSPVGIWLFIIGRVLVAAGVGILAMAYFPSIGAAKRGLVAHFAIARAMAEIKL